MTMAQEPTIQAVALSGSLRATINSRATNAGNQRDGYGGNDNGEQEVERVTETGLNIQAGDDNAGGGCGEGSPDCSLFGFGARANRAPVPAAPGAGLAPPPADSCPKRR